MRKPCRIVAEIRCNKIGTGPCTDHALTACRQPECYDCPFGEVVGVTLEGKDIGPIPKSKVNRPASTTSKRKKEIKPK